MKSENYGSARVLPDGSHVRIPNPTTCDHLRYDAEQTDFMFAMNLLTRRLHGYPTAAEVLREAVRLGYRKVS
jgi:hypothetical protein